jgi:putative (di)nucleoside polyphosphate hydrolase
LLSGDGYGLIFNNLLIFKKLWKNRNTGILQDENVIDSDGFRPNVGIIIANGDGRLFWARRAGQDAWQFPQGGINKHEEPEHAMYRELTEETGLSPDDVEIIGCTSGWLKYRLPKHLIRHGSSPVCIGQKQVWYMLRLVGSEANVDLASNVKPEFDHWRWVDYWYPINRVVPFKRKVYQLALQELEPLLFPSGAPRRRRMRGPRGFRR